MGSRIASNATTQLKVVDIAELHPVVKIKAVDADPSLIVGSRPDTFVPALSVTAKDAVESFSRAVTLQRFDEVGEYLGDWQWFDCLSFRLDLRNWRIG